MPNHLSHKYAEQYASPKSEKQPGEVLGLLGVVQPIGHIAFGVESRAHEAAGLGNRAILALGELRCGAVVIYDAIAVIVNAVTAQLYGRVNGTRALAPAASAVAAHGAVPALAYVAAAVLGLSYDALACYAIVHEAVAVVVPVVADFGR